METILNLESRCQADFEAVLNQFQVIKLEEHSGTVYGLWPDLRLGYFNPYWVSFARENQGPAYLLSSEYLGMDIMSVIPEALQPFYRSIFAALRVAKPYATQPFQFEYECSSHRVFRKFLMSFYPLPHGIIVVNSTVYEKPFPFPGWEIHPADRQLYQAANGMIYQCSHCRRVQNQGEPNRWDWVPDWVGHMPPGISHTICQVCFDYFYPKK